MAERTKSGNSIPALVMVGCMFIGIAAGTFWGNISAGTLIGLGTGFIVMAILRFVLARKKDQKPNQPPNEQS